MTNIRKTKKTLTPRDGFVNRHTHGMPETKCMIKIVHYEYKTEEFPICQWTPFDPKDYMNEMLPAVGYLGTARVMKPHPKNIGFNVWDQNDSEFVYYSIIEI